MKSRFFYVLATLCLSCSSDPNASDGPSNGAASDAGGAARGAAGDGAVAGQGESWSPDYYPTDRWRTKAPEQLGYDPDVLKDAIDFAAQAPTEGLLIVQDGYVISESYFRGFSADMPHESFSMAKSFTSALVGIAIEDGLLSGVDERLCEYYAAWSCEDEADGRHEIQLRHAMTLTTGLQWTEDWSEGASLLDNDAVQMATAARPIDYVLSKSSEHEPGTQFQYSTGDPALLSGVLEAATGMTALEYARQEIFSVIGTPEIAWSSDAEGHTTTFAGLRATVRDYAKYGFLFLNRGTWEDAQVVPASWVDVSTRPGESLVDWYGYLWHVNLPSRFEDETLPADGFTAQGVQGQFIVVIPSERLVVVRVAQDGFGTAEFDIAGLLRRILAAKGDNAEGM